MMILETSTSPNKQKEFIHTFLIARVTSKAIIWQILFYTVLRYTSVKSSLHWTYNTHQIQTYLRRVNLNYTVKYKSIMMHISTSPIIIMNKVANVRPIILWLLFWSCSFKSTQPILCKANPFDSDISFSHILLYFQTWCSKILTI